MKFEHISILKGKLSEEEKNKQIEKFMIIILQCVNLKT